MLWFVTIFLATLLLWIWIRLQIQQSLKLSKKIKCDIKSYPLIGHAHFFLGNGERRSKVFQMFGREAIKNLGLTNLWLGAKHYVVAVDAADLDVIMKTSLEKGYVMRYPREMAGNGIAFASVQVWRPRRKFIATSFSPRNLNNFVQIFDEQSNIVIEKLKEIDLNKAVSILPYMYSYSLDSICESALGVNLNSQRNAQEPVMKSFGIITSLLAARALKPWLLPDFIFKLFNYHVLLNKHKALLHDYVNRVIQSTRNTIKENKKCEEGAKQHMKYILELLIETSGGDNGYTDQELLDEILVMLIAGTDTSALGSSFVLCLLAKLEDVQEKVYREILEIFGESDRPLTSVDLPRLKYLDAVIKETLRMYPPVPMIFRQIGSNTQLPSGATLTKGCDVLINIWAAHRNPKYWGDDANQFRPERFMEASARNPAAYLAFSHGPRSCIGYLYGMMSMKTVLSTVLRKYRVLSADGTKLSGTNTYEPLNTSMDIMLKDANGFKVKLVKRNITG